MKFPREVWVGSHLSKKQHLPRQIVHDRNNFSSFLDMNNNRMNCYTSVYDYRKFGTNQAVISSIILDRLFLDFDSHGKPLDLSLEDVKLVVDYLVQNDYEFELFFSGNGFHVFVYGEVSDNIRNIQQFFFKIHKLTINNTLDKTGVQTRRLRRIPNTVNMNTTDCYYCIPLKLEDITDIPHILALAKKPTFLPPIRYGNKKVCWPQAPTFQQAPTEIATVERIGKLPILPCLKNSVMVENPTHTARYYLVSWYRTLLADMLFNVKKSYNEGNNKQILEMVIDEIKEIVKHDEVWLDWDEETTRSHSWYTINNDGGYMVPSCDKLISEGYCIGKCWRFPQVEV